MIEALQRIAKKIGRTPIASNRSDSGISYPEQKLPSEPCSAVIIYTFGSWNAAIEAADLPLNKRQPAKGFGERHFTDADLLAAVTDMAQRFPRLTVRVYEAERPEGYPCVSLIRRRLRDRFGTWAEIVQHVGGLSGDAKWKRKVTPIEV